MTRYGTLRMWAMLLSLLGGLSSMAALAGTVIWAIEVQGFWPTVGVLLAGAALVALATSLLAVSQALQAIADIGETVSAR